MNACVVSAGTDWSTFQMRFDGPLFMSLDVLPRFNSGVSSKAGLRVWLRTVAATLAASTRVEGGRSTCQLVAGVAVATLLCAGCSSFAPKYERPAPPVPDSWPDMPQADGQASVPPWHQYFSDPSLKQLIEAALTHNRDLRISLLRVEEARAIRQISRAGLFPQLDATARGARGRIPGDLNVSGAPLTSSEYRAEVGLNSWELDLWGRVHDLDEAALRQWLATEAGSRAARLALIAQVANSYITIREIHERASLARLTTEARQKSLRIFMRRFEVGSATRLELTQVQALHIQAQTLLAQLEQALEAQVHMLAQLVGSDIGQLFDASSHNEVLALSELSPGLPSDLLRRRPDIIVAEQRLIAAHANIGAARAAFFPRVALTSGFGTASSELDGLFTSGSRTWSFAPVVSLPIFDGGSRQANLDVSLVRRDVAVAEYEKSIQNAFREVSDALSDRKWLTEQKDLQQQGFETAKERARLAQLRYDNGSAAYLEVLDAQRDLLAAEQQLAQIRGAWLRNQVALYAALGGGG